MADHLMALYDPATRARLEAHWAAVRAGLYVPEAHEFRDDHAATVQSRIEVHRMRARMLIERAAAEMREADRLAGDWED